MVDEKRQAKIKDIAEKQGLKLVVLFGSQATGRLHPKSDIDVAILPRDASVLSRATEEIGDVFGQNDVEVADLSVPSPYLWHAVAQEGVLLYESKKGLFSEWKLRAMNLWYDSAWLRTKQTRYLKAWAQKHA